MLHGIWPGKTCSAILVVPRRITVFKWQTRNQPNSLNSTSKWNVRIQKIGTRTQSFPIGIFELHPRTPRSSHQSRSMCTTSRRYWLASNTPQQLIKHLRAVFQCLRKAGPKLSMSKIYFGVQEVDFLGRTIATKGVVTQKQKIAKFLEKFNLQRSKKTLQRHFGFLNYYRNYIPRLTERLIPFFQLLKTTDAKAKVPITPDNMKEFREINEALDRCCQLALRQALPGKKLVLMTDASFQAAGYAVLIKDDPNQKYTSTRKI